MRMLDHPDADVAIPLAGADAVPNRIANREASRMTTGTTTRPIDVPSIGFTSDPARVVPAGSRVNVGRDGDHLFISGDAVGAVIYVNDDDVVLDNA